MTDPNAGPGSLPAAAHLGRVALRVGSLADVVPFYRDAVGLAVDRTGSRAVLSAGDEPVVVLDEDTDAPPRARTEAGLFHIAVRVPDRPALGDALARIRQRAELTGASDHLVSEALYLRDPEGNGVEVYRDRPREEWTFTDGRVEMDTLPLDTDAVLAAAGGNGAGVPPGTDLGHVHLEVTDLDASVAFYVDVLGMNRRVESYSGAAFVAAGDYHHHVGLNTWNRRSAPVGTGRGIEWFEVVVDENELAGVRESLAAAGVETRDVEGGFAAADPDGIGIRVVG